MTASPTGWIDSLVRRGMTQPVIPRVPADDAHFLATKGRARIASRVLRHDAMRMLPGVGREHDRIEPGWRRALWIRTDAPQLGDTLMDLAPRSLLAARGVVVDLLAPAQTAALFSGDRGFARVFAASPTAPLPGYDFAIVDSRTPKAMAAKRRQLPGLPWVSIKGDYLGYDYQRGVLAARRLATLFGETLDPAAENLHARQKLWLDAEQHDELAADTSTRVAIALGGVRAERSYGAWPEVAAALLRRGVTHLTLVGSANGSAAAEAVKSRLPTGACLDLVARTDLQGTRQAMGRCGAVLAADGGLMHLALTTRVPVVALFDASIEPAWRLPADFSGAVLHADQRNVSAIEAERVALAALAVIAAARSPA